MNIICKDIQQDGSTSSEQVAVVQDDNVASDGAYIKILSIQTVILILKKDRFIFSTAMTPEPNMGRKMSKFFKRLLSRGLEGTEQVEPVPMHRLVSRGWNRKDIGWDHREQRWYHPVWPKLDPALSLSDESGAKWKLDWERDSEMEF
jgi:hypothetical protein